MKNKVDKLIEKLIKKFRKAELGSSVALDKKGDIKIGEEGELITIMELIDGKFKIVTQFAEGITPNKENWDLAVARMVIIKKVMPQELLL